MFKIGQLTVDKFHIVCWAILFWVTL